MKKIVSYDIYTGLTDKKNNKVFSLDEFKVFVNNVLSKYKVNYFLTSAVGGYVKEDNSYLTEDIVKISLFCVDKDIILDFAKLIKDKLNEEVVVVYENINKIYNV